VQLLRRAGAGGRSRFLASAAVGWFLGGCAEEPTRSPGMVASLAPRLVLPAAASAVTSALLVDGARIRVVRPPSEGVLDTLVAFPPESRQLAIRLRVRLKGRAERLSLTVELRAKSTPLFAGSALVDVVAEGSGPAAQPELTLSYVGPGSQVTRLVIAPRDTTLDLNAQFGFRVSGFDANNGPVPDLYVAWSSSDPQVAVTPAGVVRAPGSRGLIRLRARSPNGVADSTLVVFSPLPSLLVITGGNLQTGTVGTVLAVPLAVAVRAADNLGVPGVGVHFRALSGGSVKDSLVLTDANGAASTIATLGPLAATQGFEASVTGLPPVTFSITALPGAVAALLAVAGAGQNGIVGQLLANPLVVEARDGLNNQAAGVTVDWQSLVGGGTPSAGSTVTGANGRAQVTYTLGTVALPNLVRASVRGGPASAQVSFSATALPGPAALIFLISGDGQSGQLGIPLPQPLVVGVNDAFGNAAPGARVNWRVSAGGATLSAANTTTAANGLTQITVTPTVAGVPVVVQATVAASGAAVSFTLNGPLPSSVLGIASGNNQTGTVNQALAALLVVRETGASGFPVAGDSIAWRAVSGGGSFSGGGRSLTNSSGLAQITYTLAIVAGPKVVRAVSLSSGKAVSFSATALPGPPVNITIFSGDNQSGSVAALLAQALVVLVTDRFGNPVQNAKVNWSGPVGGVENPNPSFSDSQGLASTTYLLGPLLGTQQVKATLPGNGASVSFTVTGI